MVSEIIFGVSIIILCIIFVYVIKRIDKLIKKLVSDTEDFKVKQTQKNSVVEENFVAIQKNFNQIQDLFKKNDISSRESDKRFNSEIDSLKRSIRDISKLIERTTSELTAVNSRLNLLEQKLKSQKNSSGGKNE